MEWVKIEYEEGSNNTVIKKCYGAGELTIPQGVTKIGKRAFTTSSFKKVILHIIIMKKIFLTFLK